MASWNGDVHLVHCCCYYVVAAVAVGDLLDRVEMLGYRQNVEEGAGMPVVVVVAVGSRILDCLLTFDWVLYLDSAS